MIGAVILAVAGTTASALSMVGGFLVHTRPRLGSRLLGAAGAVMLAGNVVVVVLAWILR